jgi:hypothetical protein
MFVFPLSRSQIAGNSITSTNVKRGEKKMNHLALKAGNVNGLFID